ncbi:hypothetical protein CHARACLAT_019141 [Characodon lateralis]|uniref:Uncharacterized protein n=1 Tax=Characodon lateralis TaxID=208331 RepID=A0ABU7CQ60_9TELE|nr:hypothetical protein [Characodon lateralis]
MTVRDLSPTRRRRDTTLSSTGEVVDGLTKKNHETKYLSPTTLGAVVQAVVRHENRLYAKSDSRKWADAAGPGSHFVY